VPHPLLLSLCLPVFDTQMCLTHSPRVSLSYCVRHTYVPHPLLLCLSVLLCLTHRCALPIVHVSLCLPVFDTQMCLTHSSCVSLSSCVRYSAVPLFDAQVCPFADATGKGLPLMCTLNCTMPPQEVGSPH